MNTLRYFKPQVPGEYTAYIPFTIRVPVKMRAMEIVSYLIDSHMILSMNSKSTAKAVEYCKLINKLISSQLYLTNSLAVEVLQKTITQY